MFSIAIPQKPKKIKQKKKNNKEKKYPIERIKSVYKSFSSNVVRKELLGDGILGWKRQPFTWEWMGNFLN